MDPKDRDLSRFSGGPEERLLFHHFDGTNVLVVITGEDKEKVSGASSEIRSRMAKSPGDGRFDVEKLGMREVLYLLLSENRALNASVSATQARSTELINKARAFRKRLIELGDPDPGLP